MPRKDKNPVGGVFVTATDTGVGKTYVASLIVKYLKSHYAKLKIGVFKPFLTGSRKDALVLMKAAGINLTKKNLSSVNPCFLRYPLAPFVSSKLERKKVDIYRVMRIFEKIRRSSDFVVAEGSGGLLVPINSKKFVIDFVKKFYLPVILVVRPGLGTLNHTLLSIEALRRRKINKISVVINNYTGGNLAEKTNPQVLKCFLKDIPVFVLRKNSKSIPQGLKLWINQQVIS